ncbi:MAG: SBBP repeat-containing protein [Ignavibacteria bacterium]|nr:SBBP repeat-containing protein [Ignavibacteria bacterium]
MDNSGNIYFAGGDDNYSSDDYYIIKLDSNVNLEWTRSFDKNGESDYATSLKTDKHGNLFVTGYTTENEITSMTTLKYNTNGYLLWSKSEGQYSGGNDLELDMYGNAYATGFITESGSSQNYLTVKYNTNGDSLWNKKYNGTRNHRDISKIVALDINGNLYITGQSIGLGTGAYHDDIVTIKYSEAYSLNSTLNLTSIIEGFYNEDLNTMVSDTVQIFLRSVTSPYSVVDSAKSVLDISGNGTFDFSNTDVDTPYYIIVKHRNSIETWSSIGQSFTSNQLSYNFTENSDKAYGSNLVLKGNKYCIYSGDVNEDGYIDLSDVITINNDVIDFVTGYNLTDINGDNQSDLSDLITAYNNSLNFVSMKRP